VGLDVARQWDYFTTGSILSHTLTQLWMFEFRKKGHTFGTPMSGLKAVYDEHLIDTNMYCCKSHWDDNLSLLWFFKNLKKHYNMIPFGRASHKLCHAHLHFIEFMCDTFRLDTLKTVEGV